MHSFCVRLVSFGSEANTLDSWFLAIDQHISLYNYSSPTPPPPPHTHTHTHTYTSFSEYLLAPFSPPLLPSLPPPSPPSLYPSFSRSYLHWHLLPGPAQSEDGRRLHPRNNSLQRRKVLDHPTLLCNVNPLRHHLGPPHAGAGPTPQDGCYDNKRYSVKVFN